jgi:hypothetical protein
MLIELEQSKSRSTNSVPDAFYNELYSPFRNVVRAAFQN